MCVQVHTIPFNVWHCQNDSQIVEMMDFQRVDMSDELNCERPIKAKVGICNQIECSLKF